MLKSTSGNNGGGFIWFLGFIGSLVYYIQDADTFIQGFLGIFKAFVWPAMMAYHVLSFLAA